MAATVTILEFHGTTATPTTTNKTSSTVRFKNADNATIDLADPMVVPTAGTDYSFEKKLRMNAAGTFTQISNLQAYSDGANGLGTGVDILKLNTNEGTFSTCAEGTTTTGFTSIFSFPTATPIDMDAVNTGVVTATGQMGDFLVMIATVGTTASQGITPSETLTFSWDEI